MILHGSHMPTAGGRVTDGDGRTSEHHLMMEGMAGRMEAGCPDCHTSSATTTTLLTNGACILVTATLLLLLLLPV